jgi:nitroreductase
MNTEDAIKARASVREYSDKIIKRHLLEQLVDAGRRAPSARGVEPLDFIIIENKNTLKQISCLALNGAFIKQAQAAILVCSQDTKYYLEDGCAATENILIQAADLGLGACWIAGDKKDYVGEILSMLNCPSGSRLVSIISLGYPVNLCQQKKNRQLKDVIHWESF